MFNYTKYDSYVLKPIWNPLHTTAAASYLLDRYFLFHSNLATTYHLKTEGNNPIPLP